MVRKGKKIKNEKRKKNVADILTLDFTIELHKKKKKKILHSKKRLLLDFPIIIVQK